MVDGANNNSNNDTNENQKAIGPGNIPQNILTTDSSKAIIPCVKEECVERLERFNNGNNNCNDYDNNNIKNNEEIKNILVDGANNNSNNDTNASQKAIGPRNIPQNILTTEIEATTYKTEQLSCLPAEIIPRVKEECVERTEIFRNSNKNRNNDNNNENKNKAKYPNNNNHNNHIFNSNNKKRYSNNSNSKIITMYICVESVFFPPSFCFWWLQVIGLLPNPLMGFRRIT